MEIEDKPVNILIVDDEPYIHEVITRGLKSFNYRFSSAMDVQEAFALLSRNSYEVVLCDMKMPKGSGVSVLNYVKLHLEDTAVIMLTAVCDAQTAIKCLRNGASNYLIKPIDLTVLAFSVKEALEKRRLVLENKEYRLSLEEKVKKQTKNLRRMYLDSIKTIANCLEAKDKYTRGHSQRVTAYAERLAQEMALPEDMLHKLRVAGLLHDIGKIGVPETILNKPSRLSMAETAQIKLHPLISIRILKPIIHDEEIIDIILHHHERVDGKGYPDGLYGKDISLGAKILTLVDAYDAMTSNRAYRYSMDAGQAIVEVKKHTGSQFDSTIVEPFISCLERNPAEGK